ncbi:MAG: hypothetical protein ACK5A0_06820 [Polaromonas sp.]|jgi:hypothetical protein
MKFYNSGVRHQALTMMITSEFPTTGVATFVADVARRHGVSYVRSSNDALADFITRFSDDEVATDQTEDLIVALKRSKVIDGSQMVALLGNYIDEAKHVRSVW